MSVLAFVRAGSCDSTGQARRRPPLSGEGRCSVTLGRGILQTLCRGLQDFARKLLVRYGASHTDRTDQRAIGEDCLRSCTASIRLVRVANQSCEQLNVVPNFQADECASALVAAS